MQGQFLDPAYAAMQHYGGAHAQWYAPQHALSLAANPYALGTQHPWEMQGKGAAMNEFQAQGKGVVKGKGKEGKHRDGGKGKSKDKGRKRSMGGKGTDEVTVDKPKPCPAATVELAAPLEHKDGNGGKRNGGAEKTTGNRARNQVDPGHVINQSIMKQETWCPPIRSVPTVHGAQLLGQSAIDALAEGMEHPSGCKLRWLCVGLIDNGAPAHDSPPPYVVQKLTKAEKRCIVAAYRAQGKEVVADRSPKRQEELHEVAKAAVVKNVDKLESKDTGKLESKDTGKEKIDKTVIEFVEGKPEMSEIKIKLDDKPESKANQEEPGAAAETPQKRRKRKARSPGVTTSALPSLEAILGPAAETPEQLVDPNDF